MRKGELTKATILERGFQLASRVGLGGLSIGGLAEELELSKSGLFAHFKSKEALQVEVLEAAGQRFAEMVVRPALAAPRGEPRLRAIFELWMRWETTVVADGGCIFVAAASELDDAPEGPVRQTLVRLQREWMDVIAITARNGAREGHFRAEPDPDTAGRQLAHELWGVVLAYHFWHRLMRDPQAEARTRRAFEHLLERARATPPQ